jgi:hypothetical protein
MTCRMDESSAFLRRPPLTQLGYTKKTVEKLIWQPPSAREECSIGPDQVQELSVLTYLCPETKQVVDTSVETTESELRRLGSLRLSLWCPHCQTGHSIKADATSVRDPIPPSHSAVAFIPAR